MSSRGVLQAPCWYVPTWIGWWRSEIPLVHPSAWGGTVYARMRWRWPCLYVEHILRSVLQGYAGELARQLCPHALPGRYLPDLQTNGKQLQNVHIVPFNLIVYCPIQARGLDSSLPGE